MGSVAIIKYFYINFFIISYGNLIFLSIFSEIRLLTIMHLVLLGKQLLIVSIKILLNNMDEELIFNK